MDKEITYREAVRMGIRKAMSEDERVFLMGEDVGRYGGSYAVSMGLLEEFSEERIIDAPLSESAFTGAKTVSETLQKHGTFRVSNVFHRSACGFCHIHDVHAVYLFGVNIVRGRFFVNVRLRLRVF